jgi:Domain found in Dishevelled, Egl-10, and Pleckstrin (DEP)
MARHTMSALIAWPDGAAHRRLRAALMLLQVVPESLPLPALLARVRATPEVERDRLVAFVDLPDHARPDVAGTAALRARDLPAWLPDPAQRAAVWLSRSEGAAVSDAERAWAQGLGFGGWIGDSASTAAGSELEQALHTLAPRLGLAGIAAGDIARADSLVSPGDGHERWRSHVRALTGQSAEAWGRELPLQLPVAHRRWRLREYPDCVVGREVVGLWSRRLGIARGEAIVLGQAAVALQLMRHVAGEHNFEDEELFYELLDPAAGIEPPLQAVWARLTGPKGVPVADRSHRGRGYPACWIGSEAIDLIAAAFDGRRAAARLALQRLMQLGFIEHVVHEQPLLDGHFFYRFTTEIAA